MIKIKSAEFVKGVVADEEILHDGKKQYAFVGRSNVGKSSLVNSLLGQKDLVRVSRKPGKTTEANFFIINKEFYFVDLPGYGYAKANMEEREKIRQLILWYLARTENKPAMVVLVIDIKIGLTDLDKEMIDILKEKKHYYIIVANKSDKLEEKEILNSSDMIKKESGTEEVFPYSAKIKKGASALLQKLF